MLTRMAVGPAVLAAMLLISLSACAGGSDAGSHAGPESALDGKPPSGFVEMREVQVAYIGNAGGGSGTLTYQGQTYPFRIAGLGVGGIGVSDGGRRGRGLRPERPGRVPRRLRGRAVRCGRRRRPVSATSGSRTSTTSILHLKAKREGLMLSVGADAIDIRLEQ